MKIDRTVQEIEQFFYFKICVPIFITFKKNKLL